MTYQLAFIGAGNMAEAIVRGALAREVVPAERIIASDPSPQRREVFAQLGTVVTDDNGGAIRHSEQVVLAIKPQQFDALADELSRHLTADHVVISIMAGVRIAKLARGLGERIGRLVRVMPNTPMLVGRGMSAIALGPDARPGDEALATALCGAAGETVRVEESLMDAVTAVSGSGPAYVFYLAEAMERAAQELGLGAQGRTLVAQTLVGAAHLLAESPAEDDAATLRQRVTSPGGTTEAALQHMQDNGLDRIIVEAIRAAAARSAELGQ